MSPTVSVVVLGWQDEPWLDECLSGIRNSEGVTVDVVLVDNGITTPLPPPMQDVRVVRPERNLGFAGGCNFGAAYAHGDYLALVNSDAIIHPDTLAKLVETAAIPEVGIAGASIRLADDPQLLNSAGNPMHVLGLCWAGQLGEPESRTVPIDVPTASGACLMLRREVWTALGGFDAEYFAYLEDAELSLRVWRRGQRVVYCPDAIAEHHYEFSRNNLKMYLLERNRHLLLATMWSWRALILLAPPLLAFELVMLAVAAKQGWARQKLRGWGWMLRNRRHVAARRQILQNERIIADRVWMELLTPQLSTTVIELPALTGVLNAGMRMWWGAVRRWV